MKIYNVSFNDGGWHESRPVYQVVANNREEAIEMVLIERPYYRRGHDIMCSEFKIEGYVIEVTDKIGYERGKKLESLIKR